MEQCQHSSFGIKQAAYYLSRIPDIGDCRIIFDSQMDGFIPYFKYFTKGKNIDYVRIFSYRPESHSGKLCVYYIIWVRDSNLANYEGQELTLEQYLNKTCKFAELVKKIYYPSNFTAIHIYKAHY